MHSQKAYLSKPAWRSSLRYYEKQRSNMEHQALPVEGYKPQSQTSVDKVNQNKRLEEQVLRVLDELSLDLEVDKRWLAIGRTHLEQAFMAINRAIFKPNRVEI